VGSIAIDNRYIGKKLAQANDFIKTEKLHRAMQICKKIIKQYPHCADAWYLISAINQKKSLYEVSLNAIRKAIKIDPQNETYYCQLGNIQTQLGLKDEAISTYKLALEYNPDNTLALNNMGSNLKNIGKIDEAIRVYKKILISEPDLPEVYNNIGNALTQKREIDEAVGYFKNAISLKSDYAAAFHNLGSALRIDGRMEEAVKYYVKAIETNPNYAEAYDSLGRLLIDFGKPDEAIPLFERAIEIKPGFESPMFNLLFALQRTCTWGSYEALKRKLWKMTKSSIDKNQKPMEDPFANISRDDDLATNHAIARAWSQFLAKKAAHTAIEFSFLDRKVLKKKITIGYLSSNFHNHPNAHLTNKMFGLHNRDVFNVFCYSCGEDDGSIYREKVRQGCDKFIDLRKSTDVDAAKLIYNDGVDILVDLMGYTKGNRLEICALRPAPIQIRYLGMLGTTGSTFFDYLIGDQTVIPSDHKQFYSEKIIYMPKCYIISSYEKEKYRNKFTRKDMGLPDKGVVFCSFNQAYKLDPIMYNSWMNILRQVPDSVLWLQGGNNTVEQNLREEAFKREINHDRIIFADRLPKDEHIERLKLADIALDTRIVGGSATTCDALWTGVPVITLLGNHFNSRMSASILNAVGMNELVAHRIEEYEKSCIRIASDTGKLLSIREKLRKNLENTSLFDTSKFVQSLEGRYKQIWSEFIRNT